MVVAQLFNLCNGSAQVFGPDVGQGLSGRAAMRLRKTVHNAKVCPLDENGRPVAGVMDLPEGWYALPVEEWCREPNDAGIPTDK